MVYGPATPEVPVAPVALSYPRSSQQAIVRVVSGVVLIIIGIANVLLAQGFPSNAPVEQLGAFGITVLFVGGGIALIITGVVAARSSSAVIGDRKVGIFAIVAAIFSGGSLLAFLLFSLPSWIAPTSSSGMLHYTDLTGWTFFFGIPWILGIVFGVVGLRRTERPTRIVCVASIVIGLLLAIPTLTAAGLYSAGLTT